MWACPVGSDGRSKRPIVPERHPVTRARPRPLPLAPAPPGSDDDHVAREPGEALHAAGSGVEQDEVLDPDAGLAG